MSDHELGLNPRRVDLQVAECYLEQYEDGRACIFHLEFEEAEGHWGYTHVLAEPMGYTLQIADGEPASPPTRHDARAHATVLVDYDKSGRLKGMEIVDLPETAQDWKVIFEDVELAEEGMAVSNEALELAEKELEKDV
jgi:hypothetical protein